MMKRMNVSKRKVCIPSLIFVAGLFNSTAARADLYGFENISANSIVDAVIGESQLFVDVTDHGGGQVLFTFSNIGPAASSITRIYFDDGILLSLASIDDSDPGVSFSPGANPLNLPSANSASPPFVATARLSASSDSPVQPNGVNPGEILGLVFNLQGGTFFDDVIDDLNTGTLRIGIHVQGYDSGGSESFVNAPNLTPAPTALLLGIFGLSVVGIKLRKLA